MFYKTIVDMESRIWFDETFMLQFCLYETSMVVRWELFVLNYNSRWTSNRSTALVPLLYYKGIAKNICQLQCKDIRPRTFGFWRHYPQILNKPFRISNWTGSWNRHWLAENWHLYCRQTLKDKKSLMSAIQNIRRNFVLLRFFLLN